MKVVQIKNEAPRSGVVVLNGQHCGDFTGIIEYLGQGAKRPKDVPFLREYFNSGYLHREDGPAIEFLNDARPFGVLGIRKKYAFYLWGVSASFEEYLARSTEENQIKLLFELDKYRSY